MMNDKGIHLGSNGGISSALAKVYQFKLNLSDIAAGPFYNATLKKGFGILGDVIIYIF